MTEDLNDDMLTKVSLTTNNSANPKPNISG